VISIRSTTPVFVAALAPRYGHAYKANTDLLGSPDSKLKIVEYAP
jgi:hypothetical protein